MGSPHHRPKNALTHNGLVGCRLARRCVVASLFVAMRPLAVLLLLFSHCIHTRIQANDTRPLTDRYKACPD